MAITIVLSVLTTHSAIAYHNISPYTWCAGNPIKFVDPDGEVILVVRDKRNNNHYSTPVKYIPRLLKQLLQ